MEVGNVVLIENRLEPRNTWIKGVVEKTHPGPDCRTRVVSIRTNKGIIIRPVSKLTTLVEEKEVQET